MTRASSSSRLGFVGCRLDSGPVRSSSTDCGCDPRARRTRRAKALLLVALACAAAVAFATPPLPARASAGTQAPGRAAARAALARGRTLWSVQRVRSYRFRLRLRCDCGRAAARPVEVTVRDGRPVGAASFPGQLQTFPEMFRLIGQVLDDPDGGAVSVRYDARRGFPRTARLDSIGWVIDRFQPL
jgi:Family of unknown function (DUF6174)